MTVPNAVVVLSAVVLVVVVVVVVIVVVVGAGVAHEDPARSPEPVEQTSVPQHPVTVVAGYCVPPFAL